jgi:hypothetical protein
MPKRPPAPQAASPPPRHAGESRHPRLTGRIRGKASEAKASASFFEKKEAKKLPLLFLLPQAGRLFFKKEALPSYPNSPLRWP